MSGPSEVLPEKALVYAEVKEQQTILCKPKLLPVKSFSLERLEGLEKKLALQAKARRDADRAQRNTAAWNTSKDASAAAGVSATAPPSKPALPPSVPLVPKPASPTAASAETAKERPSPPSAAAAGAVPSQTATTATATAAPPALVSAQVAVPILPVSEVFHEEGPPIGNSPVNEGATAAQADALRRSGSSVPDGSGSGSIDASLSAIS